MTTGQGLVEVIPVALDGDEFVAPPGVGFIAAVGVPVVEGEDGPQLAEGVPEALTIGIDVVPVDLDRELCRRYRFTGKVGSTLVTLAPGTHPVVVHVGCGDPLAATPDHLRRAAAAVVRATGRSGTAVFVLPASLSTDGGVAVHRRAAQATAEGAVLASYRFVSHKSEDDGGRIDHLIVAGAGIDGTDLAEGVERGVRTARAGCLARDLVNEPPSSMTPRRLAEVAGVELGSTPGVALEIWDEERIAAERLGGLLGVARGSAEPPRLVRATYEPADPVEVDGRVPHVVLVGKGITFDSGGLSLKTPEGMTTMKTDMSGAAVVIAALSACADLRIPVRVTAIAPVTENMPGGRATKPGDVLTIRNGKTIEVLNTDAEGRLVLADALSLASEMRPDAIIDLATLTGACVVALGNSVAGVFGNDDDLVGRVREASARAGEETWPLPMPEEYRSHIDSDVADMKNIGKAGQAGAIAAALLLARFVDDVPWVHLDIAGPARSDEERGPLAKGGTGFGVRTLLELLGSYGEPAA
jgi:leucyl aminopeptidase